MSELFTVTVKLKVTPELLEALGSSELPDGSPALEVSVSLPKILAMTLETVEKKLCEKTQLSLGSELTVTVITNGGN
jgi:hypothetical protein